MGRAPRFSVETVCDALRESRGLLTLTASNLGCSYNTLLGYIKRHPSVKATLDQQREHVLDMAESKLYEAIMRGEPWGITLCLKTLGRHRDYVERTENESAHVAMVAVQYRREQQDAREQLLTMLNDLAAKAPQQDNGAQHHDR